LAVVHWPELALPCGLAVLSVAYPEAGQRARAVSIWAGVNGVAIVLGPVLGGVLVDRVGWRSIFFVAVQTRLLGWSDDPDRPILLLEDGSRADWLHRGPSHDRTGCWR
jgi:MFS family permease